MSSFAHFCSFTFLAFFFFQLDHLPALSSCYLLSFLLSLTHFHVCNADSNNLYLRLSSAASSISSSQAVGLSFIGISPDAFSLARQSVSLLLRCLMLSLSFRRPAPLSTHSSPGLICVPLLWLNVCLFTRLLLAFPDFLLFGSLCFHLLVSLAWCFLPLFLRFSLFSSWS